MEDVKDGGPAFPVSGTRLREPFPGQLETWVEVKAEGLSIRDFFAVHAGDSAIDWAIRQHAEDRKNGRDDRIGLTNPQARYFYADAMLAARSKP